MNLPEVKLWLCLKGRQLDGFQFRKQHPIGPYILDFYCSRARLAVEVDGASHENDGRIVHDERRDRWLAAQGIHTHRVSARAVMDGPEYVVEAIGRLLRERTPG
ncbi:MAG: hypothetical protein JWP35_400 [Caulobacter sp.]|nr:hypothetical protein [Caulobacter sp.]